MVAFLSRRMRRYFVGAVAVPVAGWALQRSAEALRARSGENHLTRAMTGVGGFLSAQSDSLVRRVASRGR